MSSLFEELQTGLLQAIDIEKKQKEKKVTYRFKPVYKYSNIEIRDIRMKLGMSQSAFASYVGVSKKTVEAWENGRIHPTGPTCRLLDIISHQKKEDFLFLEFTNEKEED